MIGGFSAILLTIRSSGTSALRVFLNKCRLPRTQVHIISTTLQASPTDTHPPSWIFIRLALKKRRSRHRNASVGKRHKASRHFQMRLMTINSSDVVTIILPVTEIPYAAARLDDLSKPITRRITITAKIRLIRGI